MKKHILTIQTIVAQAEMGQYTHIPSNLLLPFLEHTRDSGFTFWYKQLVPKENHMLMGKLEKIKPQGIGNHNDLKIIMKLLTIGYNEHLAQPNHAVEHAKTRTDVVPGESIIAKRNPPSPPPAPTLAPQPTKRKGIISTIWTGFRSTSKTMQIITLIALAFAIYLKWDTSNNYPKTIVESPPTAIPANPVPINEYPAEPTEEAQPAQTITLAALNDQVVNTIAAINQCSSDGATVRLGTTLDSPETDFSLPNGTQITIIDVVISNYYTFEGQDACASNVRATVVAEILDESTPDPSDLIRVTGTVHGAVVTSLSALPTIVQ